MCEEPTKEEREIAILVARINEDWTEARVFLERNAPETLALIDAIHHNRMVALMWNDKEGEFDLPF